ncbi:hypothetical protein GUITHDRAFT_107771 [Guillardia theta CCMP2712]|uniref:Uncharacterized protein n=1 Tax=Guillardia theta (strain CCMP2712) TaxID=905079 RepID=L1JE21_GUITC|nr:hypothetical protein GUITHDRAFT_107771 [Guillardia theta CCMP2712]EKX46567.1 hypothetical protein GUITHDRAFT_107771 [Guillardia theta CCMP2712]|eukprot:XP_005833547.1 hypothetical protein GUITHDRAFT_107771 [Guillardia theta CCMP2712]
MSFNNNNLFAMQQQQPWPQAVLQSLPSQHMGGAVGMGQAPNPGHQMPNTIMAGLQGVAGMQSPAMSNGLNAPNSMMMQLQQTLPQSFPQGNMNQPSPVFQPPQPNMLNSLGPRVAIACMAVVPENDPRRVVMQPNVQQMAGGPHTSSMQPHMRINANMGLQSGNMHQPVGPGMPVGQASMAAQPRSTLTLQEPLPMNRLNIGHNGNFQVMHHQENRDMSNVMDRGVVQTIFSHRDTGGLLQGGGHEPASLQVPVKSDYGAQGRPPSLQHQLNHKIQPMPTMDVPEGIKRPRTMHLDAVPDLPDLYNEPVYDEGPDRTRTSRTAQAAARGGNDDSLQSLDGGKSKPTQDPKKRATRQWKAFQEERERVHQMDEAKKQASKKKYDNDEEEGHRNRPNSQGARGSKRRLGEDNSQDGKGDSQGRATTTAVALTEAQRIANEEYQKKLREEALKSISLRRQKKAAEVSQKADMEAAPANPPPHDGAEMLSDLKVVSTPVLKKIQADLEMKLQKLRQLQDESKDKEEQIKATTIDKECCF